MYLYMTSGVAVLWGMSLLSGRRKIHLGAMISSAAICIIVIAVFDKISPPEPADCDIMCFPWTAKYIINAVLALVATGVLSAASLLFWPHTDVLGPPADS